VRLLTFLARRFIAGDTIENAILAVKNLNASGMTATLDILGENVKNQEQAIRTADSYISVLQTISDTGIGSNISIKLTQMGLDISDQFCFDNVSRILDKAESLNIFVRIDMEGSNYTERTLQLVYRWHEKYPDIGTVIQSYLYRSESDIKELNRRKIKVRLCKGAYKEPKSVAFSSKDDVNTSFVKLTEMLIKDGNYPAIASHDGAMIKAGMDLANKHGRSKDDFEFQMLYGPFGTHWMPYYLRRLRERKENIIFIARHLFKD